MADETAASSASGGDALSPAELRARLNSVLLGQLRPASLAVALLYAGLGVLNYYLIRDEIASWAAIYAWSASAGLLIVHALLRSGIVAAVHSNAVVFAMIVIVQIDGIFYARLTAEPIAANADPVIIMAAGCFFLSARWLVGAIAAVVGAWYLSVPGALPTPGNIEWSLIEFGSVVMAAIVFVIRVRGLKMIERQKAELERALNEIHTLTGLVPICASCKSVRDDKGFWLQVEQYVSERSSARFSHGICPDCRVRLYGAPSEIGASGTAR